MSLFILSALFNFASRILVSLFQQNVEWSFLRLKDWDPKVLTSFVINDFTPIRGNIFYDSLPKKEVSDYHLSVYRLVGGSEELSRYDLTYFIR